VITAGRSTLFEEHGTLVVEDDVIVVDASNQPGELARIAQSAGRGKVKHRILLQRDTQDAKKGLMVLRVSNAVKALKVLNT